MVSRLLTLACIIVTISCTYTTTQAAQLTPKNVSPFRRLHRAAALSSKVSMSDSTLEHGLPVSSSSSSSSSMLQMKDEKIIDKVLGVAKKVGQWFEKRAIAIDDGVDRLFGLPYKWKSVEMRKFINKVRRSKGSYKANYNVILVPGFLSSSILAKDASKKCGIKKGDRLWVSTWVAPGLFNLRKIFTRKNMRRCVLNYMKLAWKKNAAAADSVNEPPYVFSERDGWNIDLDQDHRHLIDDVFARVTKAGDTFRHMAQAFMQAGLKLNEGLHFAPYDFRLPLDCDVPIAKPIYEHLRKLIMEKGQHEKTVLIGHSMGASVIKELIRCYRKDHKMLNKIQFAVSLAGPGTGSASAAQGPLTGDSGTAGRLFKGEAIEDSVRTWPSVAWLMPHPPYDDVFLRYETRDGDYHFFNWKNITKVTEYFGNRNLRQFLDYYDHVNARQKEWREQVDQGMQHINSFVCVSSINRPTPKVVNVRDTPSGVMVESIDMERGRNAADRAKNKYGLPSGDDTVPYRGELDCFRQASQTPNGLVFLQDTSKLKYEEDKIRASHQELVRSSELALYGLVTLVATTDARASSWPVKAVRADKMAEDGDLKVVESMDSADGFSPLYFNTAHKYAGWMTDNTFSKLHPNSKLLYSLHHPFKTDSKLGSTKIIVDKEERKRFLKQRDAEDAAKKSPEDYGWND
jgi:Lecithin:cholesterol acyltransferase